MRTKAHALPMPGSAGWSRLKYQGYGDGIAADLDRRALPATPGVLPKVPLQRQKVRGDERVAQIAAKPSILCHRDAACQFESLENPQRLP
jgi:hypothetical protein